MCDTKKLCTCEAIEEGQDHWVLEFIYGRSMSQGIEKTRPEHEHIAEEFSRNSMPIAGPLPIPHFKELFKGLADITQMAKVIRAEVDWLNDENPFDFDYTPFDNDRLSYHIGGVHLAFRYFKDTGWRSENLHIYGNSNITHQSWERDTKDRLTANEHFKTLLPKPPTIAEQLAD